MKTIVLISGKQGSGKTTIQRTLHKQLMRFKDLHVTSMNFADVLYEMHDACLTILHRYYPDRGLKKDGPLLQVLGTEWGRQTIDRDLWVKIMKKKVELTPDNSVIIIGDCRFENELEAFPEAISVRLECAEEVRQARCSMWRINPHESESNLDDYARSGMFTMKFDTHQVFNTASSICDEIEHAIIDARGGVL